VKIFIYGTLKRGQCRAHVLKDQRFLGPAATKLVYRLYNVGEFPALVEDEDGVSIEGELWEVDMPCLKVLDSIEGVPTLYERKAVALNDPALNDAQTYIYRQSVEGLTDCGRRWDK